MPPKADTGSHCSARSIGGLQVRAQGDAAGVGVLDDRHRGGRAGSNSATSSKAASVSLMLL
jgi:hypothetical protein